MASRAFDIVLDSSGKGSFPKTRKWGWRKLYNLMSRFWADRDWRFMNYGYMAEDAAGAFHLEPGDEPERAFIGLYHQAVDGLDLDGKSVLEVGCGRGGGTAYIARYHGASKAVGVDYSDVTVKRAKALNGETEVLTYQWGDAENLPFEANSFDVVVNIESSHCYANMEAFVGEVARVLKPGGVFSWADLRGKDMMAATEAAFQAIPSLEMQSESQLTPGVLRALDQMNARKLKKINSIPLLSRFFLEFAGTKGSSIYKWLAKGDVMYLARRYRKAGGGVV